MSYLTPGHQSAAAQRRVEIMREIRESRIGELVMIGNPPTAEAAQRIGVCERTIRSYRAELRARAQRP